MSSHVVLSDKWQKGLIIYWGNVQSKQQPENLKLLSIKQTAHFKHPIKTKE